MHTVAMHIVERDARRRIAEAVKERRERLRMRQEDVSAAGGPSKAVMFQIENAAEKGYSDATIGRLEDALKWERGSVAAIARGGPPSPINGADGEGLPAPPSAAPIHVAYRGWRVTVYPDPEASSEEVASTLPGILEDSYRRINEAKIKHSTE